VSVAVDPFKVAVPVEEVTTERSARTLRLTRQTITRYSKPLDVRAHKKDWLNLDFLRNLQGDTREFCEYTLSHPRRLPVEACFVCGSPERKPFGTTHGMPYHECLGCTHVYADVILGSEDLVDYYRRKYFVGKSDIDPAEVDARAHRVLEPKLRFVADFVRTERRRWLDVGAGNGGVVACAREMGFEAAGLEPGQEARTFAKKVFGFEMADHGVEAELARVGKGAYDIVSFFMVLEHVTDPARQVAAAVELLAPGGLLVIEVPTADSVSAMADIAFSDQGVRQTVGVHIMNYTHGSLRHLIETNRLETQGSWFMGQDIFNLVVHMALANPAFLDSRLCQFFLDQNDALQQIIDRQELSDEVILVARKPA